MRGSQKVSSTIGGRGRRIGHDGRKVRLSRRMRVRTQHPHRRQDCQSSTRWEGWRAESLGHQQRRGGISNAIRVGSSIDYCLYLLLCVVLLFGMVKPVEGWMSLGRTPTINRSLQLQWMALYRRTDLALLMASEAKDTDEENKDDDDDDGDSLGEPGVVLNDLDWRVEKLRLEEQNTERFLRAPARFLPYDECCKWVQAFGRWETESDWREWIEMGEKRNAYIPVGIEGIHFPRVDLFYSLPILMPTQSRPDEYYGRLGQWVSWKEFLTGRK